MIISNNVFAQSILTNGTSAATVSPLQTAHIAPTPPQLITQVIYDFTLPTGPTRLKFTGLNIHLTDVGVDWANVLENVELYTERNDNQSNQDTDISTGFSGTNNTIISFTLNNANNTGGDVQASQTDIFKFRFRFKTTIGATERAIIDGKAITVTISNTDFSNITSGSIAAATIASSPIIIQVTASEYAISNQPTTVGLNTDFNLTVQAQDVNGNLDLGNTSSVTLAKGLGTGVLSSILDADLTSNLIAGSFSWTDLRYNTVETFSINATGLLTTANSTSISVDNTPPAAFNTGAVITTGGTVTANIWNSTNTGVNITVPIANDASLDGGSLQIRARIDAGSFVNLGAAATILNANLGGSQTVSITSAQLEALAGFVEGSVVSFTAIITDINGNPATTGTTSATTLTVDQIGTAAFTTGAVLTTGGNVTANIWNSTNTGVNITVPIANDASIDGGSLQIRARIDAGSFVNLGAAATILNANLGGSQTVSITSAQLEALAGFVEGSVVSFTARITDINGNPATTGTTSATTLTVDQIGTAAFTTGAVLTTGGTVTANAWNSTNTGLNITVPIANDASIDGGSLQIRGRIDAGSFVNLGAAATILNANLGGTQTVSITSAQLEALVGFAEGSVVSFTARITDINGNPSTTGTTSATTLTVDQIAPAAFNTGAVITTGGTVTANIWNSTNTGVNITVPIANDASIDGGSLQIRARIDAGSFVNLGAAATILNANLGGSQTVSITSAQLEALIGFVEGSVVSFTAIITDINGNTPTTGTTSATTLTVDQIGTAAFTTGAVLTTGGTVTANAWNSTNTGVNITVPIANDASIDGGSLQIRARIDAGSFVNLGAAATILNANLGGSQTVSITSAQLEALAGFAEGSVVSFTARITDINGNPATTGTTSATTLTVDQIGTAAFTTGAVLTTGGTVTSSYWNSTNTGVNITVPIANDASIDGGSLQIRARIDAGSFVNLGAAATILNANLGGTQSVSITSAQLEALVGFAEGSVVSFTSIITDINGNPATTGTTSATTLTVDQIAPAAFNTGAVLTTGGTVTASIWNLTNTGVNITVPIANDASLDGGSLQIRARIDAGSFVNLGAAATILNANLGGTQTVNITNAQLEALVGFAEGSVVSFTAIISDISGNTPAIGTTSATTLTVDQIAPAAFTTGAVLTTGGTVTASIWNSTNTGVNITVPIANDASIDGGSLQIRARIDAGSFVNLGAAATILNANLGGTQTVSITSAQLEALAGFAEGSVVSFTAIITDINGNTPTTGTTSATTLTVDQIGTAAFTTGAVITTGGTVTANVWNSTNTGVNITVPIANDASIDGGSLQIRARIDAGSFVNLGAAATILNANLGGTQTVNITSAQLEALVGFAEGSVVSFTAVITDINGNPATTGTTSATTLTVDQIAPAAFNTGTVLTTGGTVTSGYWNSTNTDVNITVPIANDASIDGGSLQIRARIDAGSFVNLGAAATILNANLGGTQTVSITSTQLEALVGFSEGSVLSFTAIISDISGNTPTTGATSATTLTVDQIVPAAFNTGAVLTTGGTVTSGYWNSTNTGVNITVPIANDASLNGGSLQIRADIDAGGFVNLGAATTILNANLGGTQTVSITSAQLEALVGFNEGTIVSFTAGISDISGNAETTGTTSVTTLKVDQILPTISPDEISLISSGQLTFTLNEQLNFGPGATSGFSTTNGTLLTQEYSGVGTSNIINLNGSGWNIGTLVNYSGLGNITDLAGNAMAAFSNHIVILNVINMAPGDLAFTYYRSDDPNEFAFVLLKDIPAGTKIKFTNNGWNESTTSFRGGEETLIWEANVNYYAGLEVVIRESPATVLTTTVGTVTGSVLTLSTAGDQIFAYQGNAASPTFIAGIHVYGTWDASSTNSQSSSQPAQLITVPPSSFNITHTDNIGYDRGVLTGTVSAILTDINSSPNWDSDDNASNGISFTVPTGGLTTFALPPTVDAVVPSNGSTVAASTGTLQIDFNENMSKGLVFGGNITLKVSGGATIASIPISDAKISVTNDIASIDISTFALVHGTTYEVDVDGFLFQNADENHNTPIVGSTTWSFDVDGVAPTVASINRGVATPAANVNFGTTGTTSVTYVVTFSEPVQSGTVATTDFTTAGTASGGTETVSGISGSGDTYTLTVSGINKLGDLTINYTGAVDDIVGNTGSTGAAGNQSFVIINPEPTEQPTALLINEGVNNFTLDLSWTAGAGAQLADGYLILYKTTAGSFPTDPTDLISQTATFNGTNGVANSATNSISITGLTSATEYDFKIYAYTNSGNQIDYKINGTPLAGSAFTGAGELSTLALISVSNTISSLTINQAQAAAAIPNFVFRISDDGLDNSIDDAPMLINEISFIPGTGNDINWADAIEGAQLDDGVNIWNTVDNGADITIDNGQITFSNLPTTGGDLGHIADNAIKNYNLRIWLKNPISNAALQNTIDGLNFVFEVNQPSFAYDNGSSKVAIGQTANSVATRNAVSVLATALNWEVQPPLTVGVLAPFSVAPVIEAVDANGNRDINYVGAITTVSNTGTIAMNNNPDASGLIQSLTSGIYTFDIAVTPFSYGDAGDGTLTVTSGALAASPPSNAVTVSYSVGSTISLGAGAEPLTISSLQTGTLLQVFDFTITDDGLPPAINDAVATIIDQITITAGTGNEVTNWSEVIEEAIIQTNLGIFGTPLANGAIGTNDITFSGILNSSFFELGHISDGSSRTFQLLIRLKSTIISPFNNDIDNQNFVFEVTDANVLTETNSSRLSASQSVNSGALNNKIIVNATKLTFDPLLPPSQQPDATADYGSTLATQPIATARDDNGNLDLDYAGPVTVTNAAGLATTNNTTAVSNGVVTLDAGFLYNQGGNNNANGTLTFTDNTLVNPTVTTSTITVNYSSNSDIVKNATFNGNTGTGYASNIDYSAFQESVNITNNSNSVVLEGFTLRDGGVGNNDSDGSNTQITSLIFNITNWQNLDRIELYDAAGTTPLASSGVNEQSVTGNVVTFTGLNLATPDDSNIDFTLRASFKSTVDDNEQIEMSITNAVVSLSGSQLSGAILPSSSLSGDENRIEVTKTKLIFANILGTSIDTPFSTTISALDDNNNLDLDFAESITSFTNSATLVTSPATITGAFAGGIFSPNFEFTQAADGVTLTIETNTFDGSPLAAGVSNAFNVTSSFDSNITLSSTPSATFEYVAFTSSDITGSGNAFELARFSINDGGNAFPDIDGAATTLDEITFSLSNSDNIQKIAIYDGITEITEISGGTPTVNFTGLNLVASDDLSKEFIVYVTFNTANVIDKELQQIIITDAVELGGSQFSFNEAGLVNGTGAGTTALTNILNVTATNFDFTTDPNSVEGVGVSLINNPVIQAIDIYGNLDTDYIGDFNLTTPPLASNGAQLSFNSGTFNDGVFDGITPINGLQYNTIGDGTITISESVPVNVTNGLGLNFSTDVEVVTSEMTQINISAYPPQLNTVLPSGRTNRTLIGFNLNPKTVDGSFNVIFDEVRIDFSKDTTDIIENVRLYKVVGPGSVINIDYTLVPNAVIDVTSTKSSILINGFSELLNSTQNVATPAVNEYLIVFDVSVAANSAVGSISASITPQTSYLINNNGNVTGSTFSSNIFTFEDTRDPLIVDTNPVNGSIIAPDGNATYFTITLDENVFLNNPQIDLYDFNTNNLISSNFIIIPNGIEPTKTFNLEFYQSAALTTPLVLNGGDRHYITIAQNGFIDQDGNTNKSADGLTLAEQDIENKGFWNFKIIDAIPPFFQFNVDNSELLSNTYDLGFDIKVKLDEPGTAYVRVVPNPSVDSDVYDIFTNFDGSVTVDQAGQYYYLQVRGLTANTTYDIYVGAIDVGGNASYFDAINASNTTDQHVQKLVNISTLPDPAGSNPPVLLSVTDFDFCVGEFQLMNSPISLIETDNNGFVSPGTNIIDIVLPSGYTFNTSVGTVEAIPYSGSGDVTTALINYTNSSTARISFTPTGTTSRDEIKISNLEIMADLTAANSSITINSNISGLFDFPIINLSVATPGVASFSLDPNNTVINANITNQEVLLTQDVPVDPYIGETYGFTGPGVVDDILYVDLAGLGIKTIKLTQTDQYGCQSVGSVDINIINNKISGLNFTYCDDVVEVPIPVNGTGQLAGYEIQSLNVSIAGIPVNNQADPNSFVTNGITYSFFPSTAIPAGNTADYVQLEFNAVYVNQSDINDLINISQIVSVYPKPDITLTSSTFSDDLDGTIEACEDYGNIIFVGQPLTEITSTGDYILTKNIGSVNASSQIIKNSDGSITINTQNLKSAFGSGAYTLIYNYNNVISTCNGSSQIELFIYDKPVASFEVIDENDIVNPLGITGCVYNLDSDNPVRFRSTSSIASGAVSEWLWNFDDPDNSTGDNPDAANTEIASHQYPVAGSYSVELQVISDFGCASIEIEETLVIGNNPTLIGNNPTPEFTYTNIGHNEETIFTIDDTKLNLPTNEIASLEWSFDERDGNGIVGPNPIAGTQNGFIYNYPFTSLGFKDIQLTITSDLNCITTITDSLFIVPKVTLSDATNYTALFEDNTDGWITWGENNSWQIANSGGDVISGPSATNGGSTFWVTGTNTYNENEKSYVYSPIFDFTDLDRPLVTMDIFNNISAENDGVVLEYSTLGFGTDDASESNWNLVGSLNSGINWYDTRDISNSAGQLNNLNIGWSNAENSWEAAKNTLSTIAGEQRIQFRISFESGSNQINHSLDGFAFDNFFIGQRTRTVLVENFTNINDPIAVEDTDELNDLSNTGNTGTELIVINYHTDFPSNNDLNDANRVDPSARTLYYNISQVPRAIMDGNIAKDDLFKNWGKDSLDLRTLALANFNIEIVATTAAGVFNIETNITPKILPLNGDNVVVMTAIIEKTVSGFTPALESVFRKMLPSAAGIRIPTSGLIQNQVFTLDPLVWTPSNVTDPANLAVVVFIQDEDTKEIYQAELIDLPAPEAVTATDNLITNTFSLYPNPANDRLTIMLSQNLQQNSTLKIFDNFGKVIFEKLINESTIILNTEDYASGMYHVQISNDETVSRQRMIIRHSDR